MTDKPIVCWNISQAWEVKEKLTAKGYHVTIQTLYPFADYPRRNKKKRAFACYAELPDNKNAISKPEPDKVLSFVNRMIDFSNRDKTEKP